MNPLEFDIVMPVYNEGENIVPVLRSLSQHVKTPFRVLICYDRDDDNTLAAVNAMPEPRPPVVFVKNEGKGVFGAIQTGFRRSTAPVILTMPADDDYNAERLDAMAERFHHGAEMVCPSRFMSGGCMKGCPPVKAVLVRMAAFFLFYIVRVPTHDPTNGFRFFSRRVIEQIPIETEAGFAYSIELMVKCHRLRWKIDEQPVQWFERKAGTSRFRVFKWAPIYLRWVRYAMATTFLRRGPETVKLRSPPQPSS